MILDHRGQGILQFIRNSMSPPLSSLTCLLTDCICRICYKMKGWPSQFCLRNQLAIDHMGSNTYEVNQQLKLSSSPPPFPPPFQMLANESSPPGERVDWRWIWTRVNFSILHLAVSDGCSRAMMGGGGGGLISRSMNSEEGTWNSW